MASNVGTLSPDTLMANMGTPLIWFGACHLLVLNLLIGIIEGRWIAGRTQTSVALWCTLMILANYASAFAGAALLGPILLGMARMLHGDLWIGGLLPATLLLPIVVFPLTIVVEVAFVLIGANIKKSGTGRSFKAFVAVQLMTYVPIAFVYVVASDFSAVMRLSWKSDASSVVDPTAQGWVYFLSADGSGVHRCRLDGSSGEMVFDLDAARLAPDRHSYILAPLYAAPIDLASTSRQGDHCSLRLRQAESWPDDPVIVERLHGRAGVFVYYPDESEGAPAAQVERFDAGWSAATLSWTATDPTKVSIRSDFYISDRIEGDPRLNVAYQTTPLTWTWSSATVINDRYVIACVRAWRSRFVVLIDMHRDRAVVLAEGWSPVVVLDPPAINEP